jgi:MFS transporter, AAHS family, 3-hydroxyphenylpropionic acid transporter
MADPALRSSKVGIIFCGLCALSEGIDLQVAGMAAAGIGVQFHPTPTLMGTFFSASTFGLFIGALIAGRVADNIGRRTVLLTSVFLFGGCSLLNAMAWNMPSLVAFRLLTGLGLGGALPMVIIYVSETSTPKWQRASVAMVYAMMPLGGALISLFSLLIPAAEWRAFFILGGIVPLLLTPLLLLFLPESKLFRQSKGEAGMPPSQFSAILADGRAGRTLILWVSFFLELLLLYLLLNWLPTLLLARGATHGQAGLAQIGFNLGGVLTSLAIGVALDGRLRSAAITTTFIAIPLLLVVLARANVEAMGLFVIVLLLGCAVLSGQAYLYASAPGIYPVSIRGMGAGAAVAAGRVGSIVGPQLGGLLKSAGHDTPQLLMDILPLVIAGSIASLAFAWITRRPT